MPDAEHKAAVRELMRAIRAEFPGFREALAADARMTALGRGERAEFRNKLDTAGQILRLMWVSDAFFAQAMYRLKATLQKRGVPVLPRIAHKIAMATAQVAIGDPVILRPGIYIVHGQVVIDGIVEIGSNSVIMPWVTVGLRAGSVQGPTVGQGVSIGTGAKVIGPVIVGDGAVIGANSVVTRDVRDGQTVAGTPARALRPG